MKLVQYYDVDQSIRVGVVQNEQVVDITDPAQDLSTTLDFVDEARRQRRSLDDVIAGPGCRGIRRRARV